MTGAPAVRQAGLWNIANILTMIRLLLVPVFVVLMLAGGGHDAGWRSLAWAAFTVAMITDLFDGELARRYDLVTDFGKIADPIADKAIWAPLWSAFPRWAICPGGLPASSSSARSGSP